MSHRREQLESALAKAISKLIAAGFNDPRISGLITVTEVRVTEDGHTAVVKVSVLPETRQRAAIQGLRHAAGHIQRQIHTELRIRQVPHIDFVLDESIKKQASLLQAIQDAVAREDANRSAQPPADSETDASHPPSGSPEDNRP